ncbi:MAG: heparan-alpha-glucosaminide N-acetyltransferase [Candidatus Micrarchaeota archaeon]|nr:heparan-alpha-glucosaminide N-acetyltransferase [Candidatus Micrarchaeota archaeon]
MGNRIWELDALRGLAIVMMVVFHFLFDLNLLEIIKIAMYEGFLLIFQRTTASLFLLVVGMVLSVAYANGKIEFSYYLKRGLSLLGIALLITAVTWIYSHESFIIFGVIHLIAFSVIISYVFLRKYYLNLFAGITIILIGLAISGTTSSTNLLLWLGIPPSNFYTFDYFPVFPWFGMVLIGIFLGKFIYVEKKMSFEKIKNPMIELLSYLGKRSIIIYLAHQPVLLAILMLYKYYLR